MSGRDGPGPLAALAARLGTVAARLGTAASRIGTAAGRIDGRLGGAGSRVATALGRRALGIAALVTAALVGVLFYLPVTLVLRQAVVVAGRVTLAPIRAVLTDPFYVGVLADVVRHPFAVDRHVAAVVGYLSGFAVRWGHLGALPWPHLVFPAVRTGLFGFTAYQALLSTAASVLLGLPGAYVLARFEFHGRRAIRSVTIVPFVLPGIMVAIGFVAMFGDNGALNDALRALGLPTIHLLFTLKIIVLAHAFYNAPLVTRVTTAAWETVDARAVETARSLGAGRQRAFRDVVLPQLVPAIATGAVLTFLFTFMTFPIVLALGGLKLATIEVWVYDRVRRLAYTEAASLAIVETVLTLGLTYAYLHYEARQSETGTGNPLPRRRLVPAAADLESLSRRARAAVVGNRLAIFAYGAVVTIVIVGPLLSMLWESVSGPNGLTLRYYEFLVARQTTGASFQTKPLPAVRNSLLFAVGTVLVALPMGVTVAVVTNRHRWGDVVETGAMAPLAISGIITGIGLQSLVFGVPIGFGYQIQIGGAVAIVAAHAVAAYPFVVRNVGPLLARVERSTVESARALGATRARALLDVELPQVAAGVVAGAAFAFAISVGEFDSTVILAQGPQTYTMPVAVERYLGNRTLGPASAMGSVLLVVSALSFVVVERLGGRFERE